MGISWLFPVEQQPFSGLGRFIVQVYRSYSDTHTHTHKHTHTYTYTNTYTYTRYNSYWWGISWIADIFLIKHNTERKSWLSKELLSSNNLHGVRHYCCEEIQRRRGAINSRNIIIFVVSETSIESTIHDVRVLERVKISCAHWHLSIQLHKSPPDDGRGLQTWSCWAGTVQIFVSSKVNN